MLKRFNNTLLIFFFAVVLTLILFPDLPVLAEEAGTDEGDDLFAVIVEFVVDRDSALASQRSVIETVRRLGELKPGRDFKVPDYAQSSLLQGELESVIQIQQAQQTYGELKRELISELSREIVELLTLKNRIENQTELHGLLNERLEDTERQVQAGIISPDALWQLSEKIIDVQTSIADAKNRRRILRRKIAFNYGGEEWRKLLDLLQDLEELEDVENIEYH